MSVLIPEPESRSLGLCNSEGFTGRIIGSVLLVCSLFCRDGKHLKFSVDLSEAESDEWVDSSGP